MSTRWRGHVSESRSPTATEGFEAVDQYLVALDETDNVEPARLAQLERRFIEHARFFAERCGITFAAWRDVGVPARVLASAGINQDRGG